MNFRKHKHDLVNREAALNARLSQALGARSIDSVQARRQRALSSGALKT